MNDYTIWDVGYEMFHGLWSSGSSKVNYKVFESQLPDNVSGSGEPSNVISVFTAAKILSDSFSQMSVDVKKDGEIQKDSKLFYSLKYEMNNRQNNQVFWSTLEYHRNVYGNAFVDTRKGKNEIIHPALISDYDYKGVGDSLRFKIAWSNADTLFNDRYKEPRNFDEWVSSKHILHFKGLSTDVFGLPPVSAAQQSMDIMNKASNTIIQFYNNRALSPMALESTINTAVGAKATSEGLGVFNAKYQGTVQAGKTMQLPPNTKLTPLAIHFADAELIETMKFTKDEIYTMYKIPSFMTSNDGDKQADIEQQSLSFKTFTLAPITNVYQAELEYKLLSKKERIDNVKIEFDLDALIEVDLSTKALTYRNLVTSGIISPSEASEKMGFGEIKDPNAKMHFVQVQNIAIEDYDKYEDPSLKVSPKDKEDINEKSDK